MVLLAHCIKIEGARVIKRQSCQVTNAIESLQAQAVRLAGCLEFQFACFVESQAKPGAGTAHLAEEKAGHQHLIRSKSKTCTQSEGRQDAGCQGQWSSGMASASFCFCCPEEDIPAGMCSDELEINDYPQIARQKITHRDLHYDSEVVSASIRRLCGRATY